ncbi:hypothetical protein EV356DRAFT_504537 [Viridothelium virens]|uniref:Secreted protein n=1 Tax=Viridothelium virens TaxID=1048519 RepID=A0A6A6H4W7_VIRVR|nr:hypothetical protein EV356DRAFT_504537 [Viridothelium virens]
MFALILAALVRPMDCGLNLSELRGRMACHIRPKVVRDAHTRCMVFPVEVDPVQPNAYRLGGKLHCLGFDAALSRHIR